MHPISLEVVDENHLGSAVLALLGRKWYEKALSVATSPIKTVSDVTSSAARATTHAVLHPSVQNFESVVTKPVRAGTHDVLNAGRDTLSVAKSAGTGIEKGAEVAYRVARRMIKFAAQKIILGGDGFLGEAAAARMTKPAAQAVVSAGAIALLSTNSVTLPIAAAGPALAIPIVNEIYDAIEKKMTTKGITQAEAIAEVKKESSFFGSLLEGNTPYYIGGGILLVAALTVAAKKKRKG